MNWFTGNPLGLGERYLESTVEPRSKLSLYGAGLLLNIPDFIDANRTKEIEKEVVDNCMRKQGYNLSK